MDATESDHQQQRLVPLNPDADSLPLKDAIICCTSVPDEKRTELAAWAHQMGAIHRFDLTLDVTHLVVGNYDTPKYRYVAKERPDVRPMTMGWIEAVRELWMADQEIDIEALEEQHLLPTLFSLKFSMTGCEDLKQRLEIADKVKANGADYEGDLTKQITHLISFRTEGAKYRAAKIWGLQIVSVEWLRDSLERGMILDEKLYDPSLPPEERGKCAWDRTKPKRPSLGKRSREDSMATLDGGRRKLRRTASTKLGCQSEKMWGDIVGGGMVFQVSRSGQWGNDDDPAPVPNDEMPIKQVDELPNPPTLPNGAEPQQSKNGFFFNCRFYFHGFTQPKTQVLCTHLLPQDAEIATTLVDFIAPSDGPDRLLLMVVPSDLPVSEHPTLPQSNNPIRTVTEWWVERCLHHKKFLDPEEHVIGRPFPLFPISNFKELTISTAAFSGIDLLHVTRAVALLGATYSENFTKNSSILLTKSTYGLRKDKMEAAREWKIPIVDASWLWESIEAGTRLPLQRYCHRSQKRATSITTQNVKPSSAENPGAVRSKSELARPVSRAENSSPNPTKKPSSRKAWMDKTAFISDEPLLIPVKEEIEFQPGTMSTSDKTDPLSEINLNSPTRTISTAPAPSDHPAPRPKEDISTAVSNLLAKTKATSVQPEEGRRRGTNRILGRAASNVSTTSTPIFSRATSVDSTATHGTPVEYPPSNNSTVDRIRQEQIERFMRDVDKGKGLALGDVGVDSQLSSTQLQYADPESREYKERVMARMVGETVDERRGKERGKVVTLKDGVVGADRGLRKRLR